MSQCRKFAPNIFNKTKCSNCFRQKEEHTAEALECNRASRSIARSGYLFVAPDWDFSVPLNRTKRWQRRWFVLYDDGELNYSVDEHPDTVPQGSVDMSKVLEVTGAEQVTGHPHSLALTSPDRVTFVKAASREDARWWAELLAVFPRRHKRNATFPGGRASPSLPQLGRSASPQPPRPRHLSCSGPSPRTNFTTPPLKEERESPAKEDQPPQSRPVWVPEPTSTLPIEPAQSPRSEYIVSSGSPPTRDKLRCEDKVRARRDWRHERLRDIATALTDRSPESSLALPAEGLLHLKKGWLWYLNSDGDWVRRWWVLCGPTLSSYLDQDEQGTPETQIELSTVTGYSEMQTDTRYGLQIQSSGQNLVLSAVTQGIRSNWLQAMKKAAPNISSDSPNSPATPRSLFLSSDEEYRTASEGGRRDSGDWSELPPSPPLARTILARVKERTRTRPKLPRSQSRQSTIDSVSTDELDSCREPEDVELRNTINKQSIEMENLKKKLISAESEVQTLETELSRLKSMQLETMNREKETKEMTAYWKKVEKELSQKLRQAEEKYSKDQKSWQSKVSEAERSSREMEDRCSNLAREMQAKQRVLLSLQEELNCANDRLARNRQENDRLFKKLQEIEGKNTYRIKRMDSLTDLTNIDLDIDLNSLGHSELIEQCLDLRSRFEKAVIEIRTLKRELRESHMKYDNLELQNLTLKRNLEDANEEAQAHSNLMANRVQDLTNKLATAERQARNLKSKLQDSREKRRSLSLKGRENFSINKEVEDKVTELEAKILALERGRRRKHKREKSSERASPTEERASRRPRRKSLDSATSSEPMKLLMRLSSLETKVTSVNTSSESLNTITNSMPELNSEDQNQGRPNLENIIISARKKLNECFSAVNVLKNSKFKRAPSPNFEKMDRFASLELALNELGDTLNCNLNSVSENEEVAIQSSAGSVVKQLIVLLNEKLSKINEKKQVLRSNGKLDEKAHLELLAEKIAFENILIGRIQLALQAPATGETNCQRLLSKEALETGHLITSLQTKLQGGNLKQVPPCKTSAEYLTKVLTKCLVNSANGLGLSKELSFNLRGSVQYLKEEQAKLNAALTSYKIVKLPQLAEALANETINLTSDSTCLLDNNTISETWKIARNTVNSELIQSEINHVLMRTAQMYEANSTADDNYFFSFFASERAALELWSDSVETALQAEMDRNIQELSETYKNTLNKLQRQNWRSRVESERSAKTANALLCEFADIVAHKALIDARISVLSNDTIDSVNRVTGSFNFVRKCIENEKYWSTLEEGGIESINQSLEAEFKLMLRKYIDDCGEIVSVNSWTDVNNSLREIDGQIRELLDECGNYGEFECIEVKTIEDVCRKCVELKNKLSNLKEYMHEIGKHKLGNDEDRRPLYLGTEYLSQVENLRAAYRRTLSECESRKQQADLEQLQVLCERVLVAMEHWHRRALLDLRETHTRELQALRQDKEQALAEETQATLAALDAMRKAHEAEVQREVARFKQEFARRQRDELLELSERLSVKCLEAAALEEQLGSATRQLAHAQQHILQLERNPQLSLQN